MSKKLLAELDRAEKRAKHHSPRDYPGALLLALLIPVLCIPLYLKLGANAELKVVDALRQNTTDSTQIQQLLEDWVHKKPKNEQALYLLGNQYMQTGSLKEAADVYRQLFEVSEGHPRIAAELAQILFLASNNKMDDEIRQLYQRALRGEENNTTALGLKGIDAFSQEDYQGAVTAWQQALGNEPDPAARQSLSAGIIKARTMLGETVARIRVQIALSPQMKALPENTRVVLFARSSNSEQPPLAAVPLRVGDLPREVILDDSTSMMIGGNLLSAAETVDIIGRISLSGNIMDADYQVEAKAVKTSSNELVELIFTPAG